MLPRPPSLLQALCDQGFSQRVKSGWPTPLWPQFCLVWFYKPRKCIDPLTTTPLKFELAKTLWLKIIILHHCKWYFCFWSGMFPRIMRAGSEMASWPPMQADQGCLKHYLLPLKYFHVTLHMQYAQWRIGGGVLKLPPPQGSDIH